VRCVPPLAGARGGNVVASVIATWDAAEVQGERRRLAEQALDGYVHGPDATVAATARAVERAASARSLVLVEGISDLIALETVAERTGRDLASDSTVVVPMGGAQAISRFLTEYGPPGADLQLCGLCDAGEERFFRRGLERAGLGRPRDRQEMAQLGFFVCVDDLEHELMRATGPPAIEALLDAQGDLGSFRTLQKQAAWRDRSFDAQMHRWLRAGARRNLRYARLLVELIEFDRVPRPLVAVLDAARRR